MKALGNLLGFAIIVGVIWLLGMGVYHGSGYLWDLYLILDVELRTVLLTGIAALLVAAMIVASALRYSARMRARVGLIEPKRVLYIELTDLYSQALKQGGAMDRAGHEQLRAELERVEPAVLMLASASVFKSHTELKAAVETGEWNTEGTEKLFKRFVTEARRDLRRPRLYEETRLDIAIKATTRVPDKEAVGVQRHTAESIGPNEGR